MPLSMTCLPMRCRANVWHSLTSATCREALPSQRRYVPPLDGEALAAELRSHHVYITGSQNEPGGNHQNEGALCGLPIIYRTSGCTAGILPGLWRAVRARDLVESGRSDDREYPHWVTEMPRYPRTAEADGARMDRAIFESGVAGARGHCRASPALAESADGAGQSGRHLTASAWATAGI